MTAIVFPTLGSDLLANGPPCLSAIRRAFLLDPIANLTKPAADCAHQSPQITFITPTH